MVRKAPKIYNPTKRKYGSPGRFNSSPQVIPPLESYLRPKIGLGWPYYKKMQTKIRRMNKAELVEYLNTRCVIPGELSEKDARRAGIDILDAYTSFGRDGEPEFLKAWCIKCKCFHSHGLMEGMRSAHAEVGIHPFDQYYLKPNGKAIDNKNVFLIMEGKDREVN